MNRPEGWEVAVADIRKASQGLKNVSDKFGVGLISSAPEKLAMQCGKVNQTNVGSHCYNEHGTRHMNGNMIDVYEIPFSCATSYVGQTGQRPNDRFREHRAACPYTCRTAVL